MFFKLSVVIEEQFEMQIFFKDNYFLTSRKYFNN